MSNPADAGTNNDAATELPGGTIDAPAFVPVALDPDIRDVHEYDAGDIDAMRDEPGLPDELVEQIALEPVEVFDLNTELPAEFLPLAGAVVFAIVITETVKGMGLRDFLHKRGRDNHQRTTIYRWLLFVVAAITAQTFGFRRMMLDLMGLQLSYVESIVYGACSVTVISGFVYNLKLSRVFKARIYRLIGVTEDDVKTKTGNAPVTPDQIAADRKARGLDDD